MAADLHLWLLGDFRVEVDGQLVPEHRWRRRKASGLVKLLALAPRHRLHREQLMDALWPDLAPPAAGANLRKAVHFARQVIGPEVLRVRDELVWLEADGLWVDVEAFQAAIARAAVTDALELYRGDLLVDDRFEPWAEERRELLRMQLFRSALGWAADRRGHGDLHRASQVLERIVELDPLNEEAQLGLVRIQAEAGHRHLALRSYRQFEYRMRDDLGQEPSAAARRLRDDILRRRLRPGPTAVEEESGTFDEDLLVDELRVVTVVAVRLADSGPTTVPEQIRPGGDEAVERVCHALEAWGGTVEHTAASSIEAVFGFPALHENDASLALSAAVEIAATSSTNVQVGVHTADVVGRGVPPSGLSEALREPLVVARRLAEAAPAATILASERTCRSSNSGFLFSDQVEVAAAAGSPLLHARRVRSRRHTASATSADRETPFVGRRVDLDAVISLFGDVVATGHPRLVTILGPAGIGKSRLTREAITAISRQYPSTRVLIGRCPAAGQAITYWALAELLHQLCGITRGDSAIVANNKLQEGVRRILIDAAIGDDELDPTVWALAATAAIAIPGNPLDRSEPRVVADELSRAWPRFLTACAVGRPTLVVIEDLHWAGGSILDMVERLATRGDGPYMILVTARSEFVQSRPGFGGGTEGLSTISLRALSGADSESLVRQLASARLLSEAAVSEILARAEGSPFFIEQLALHLAHDGGDQLPDALHSLLAARIDALPIAERRVLQEASVVGRVFWATALADTLPGVDVPAQLRRLEHRALIYLRPHSTLHERLEYAFRHVLLRDVAYASLTTSRRVHAHAEASAWIEVTAGDRLEEFIELIASHDLEAATGDPEAWGADFERVRRRAYTHALQAAASARRRSAVGSALQLDEQALELSRGDEERLSALMALGDDCEVDFRGDEARDRYREALQIARRNPALDHQRARLCFKLAYMMAMGPGAFWSTPDPTEVDQLVEEGLAVAGDDEASRGRLLLAKGASARLWQGSEPFGQGTQPDPLPIRERITAVHTALRVAKAWGLDDVVTAANSALGILYGIAGRYHDALALAERRLERAETGPRHELTEALRTSAVLTITVKSDFESGLALGRRCHSLSRDALPHQQMHALWPVLAALYHLGLWEEMGPFVEEHIAAFEREPAVGCHFVRDGPLIAASALVHRGEIDRARALAALPGDPTRASHSASAWQAWYLVVSGDPVAARRVADPKARQGRMYGPQHGMALVEALVALKDWDELDEFLPHARAATTGNALLQPFCDRALGLIAAASGDRQAAAAHLLRALGGFERLKQPYEAARTRQALAPFSPCAEDLLREASDTYERLGVRFRAK